MEFAKYLGREGICRVEENDKGIHVSWIDNSPENLRRQDAIRKKERQDKGDEDREQMLIREQIRRAQMENEGRGEEELDDAEKELKRQEGEKIKLSFGAKPTAPIAESSTPSGADVKVESGSPAAGPSTESAKEGETKSEAPEKAQAESSEAIADTTPEPTKVSLKMGFSSKPKNVFAAAKKNALGGKKAAMIERPKKMSEAERIMREEMERKKNRGPPGFGGGPPQKKQRF
jgi:DNA/RNA-binding protein KIN17